MNKIEFEPDLFIYPLIAKRIDAHHADISDADGMVIARMAGHEEAFARAEAFAAAVNRASEPTVAWMALCDGVAVQTAHGSEPPPQWATRPDWTIVPLRRAT